MTEGVQSRGDQGGDSSAAFSQRTNVSIETAIDHMAEVLSKISGRQQTNVQQMPQELKEVIQNMIRQSFSIETTLGQGLGSTAASQRFSTDQLTTLARMLNQLGTLAETGDSIPRVGDDLAALLSGLKSALARESGGTFEPIMLTKAAFQLLDTGNAELLPKELQTFLSQLNAQGTTSAAASARGAGATSLSFLNQLVQLLMPRDNTSAAQQVLQNADKQEIPGSVINQSPAVNQEARPSSAAPNANSVPATIQETAFRNTLDTPVQNTQLSSNSANISQNTGRADGGAQPPAPGDQRTQSLSAGTENPTPSGKLPEGQNVLLRQGETAASQEQISSGSMGKESNTASNLLQKVPSTSGQEGRPQAEIQQGQNNSGQSQPAQNTSISTLPKQADLMAALNNNSPTRSAQNAGSPLQSPQMSLQTEDASSSVSRETALSNKEGAPEQSSEQAKSPEMQNTISRIAKQNAENAQQTMNVLRNLAQTLLQNENLSQREALILQNFVNGRSQTLSETDAKQLQQLIQLTQQNIPGTVRQAALEQQIPDLPRLWAFMQMSDLVKTRGMTAEQYKRAGRDVAALALTMRNALEGENAAPQQGQRSMNFVMPLFMGASEYPAYIHVYDESHQDEETERVKKETWLRICVLTDNIGTVELINRIYEENHVDMRLYFSDADAAWEFRHVLDQIRETADGTSLIIEGIQIGAIGERRFFTN